MLRSYLLLSIRNLRVSAVNSFANILSLSIAFAACLSLFLFVENETNFDSFNSKRSSIYRLYTEPHYEGSAVQKVALSIGWIATYLQSDFPEVGNATRFWNKGKTLMTNGENRSIVNDFAAVDSTFLEVFDFEMLNGDRSTALDQPNSIILTEPTAALLFKDPNDATGKSVLVGDLTFNVTGIMKSPPANSHLQFSALASLSTYSRTDRMFKTSWDGSFLNTYVLLEPNSDAADLETKLPAFLARRTGKTDINKGVTLRLQSLADVHLGSSSVEHDYNNYRKFNGDYIRIFIGIGIIILVIACVNFVNLTLALASQRWKEVGVRKSIGAAKYQLLVQFIFESCFLCVIALVMAMGITSLFVPILNDAIGRNLTFITLFQNTPVILTIAASAMTIGILTGLYPFFFLNSQKPSAALKGRGNSAVRRSFFGPSLVVFQFALAIGMVIGTLVVHQQLSFITTADIGFSKDQIVLIDMNQEVNNKFTTLKQQWLQNKDVLGVTASSQRIGNNFNGWGFKVKLNSGMHNLTPSNVNVDYDYLKVYQIKLTSGRDFSRDFATDQGKAFIINETMAKELNLENPVGTPSGHAWDDDDKLGTIIGVAKDFNYNSLHNKIGMLALVVHPEWGYEEISVKIDGNNLQESIAAIKEVWDSSITTYPFNYTFLDEHFDSLYRSEAQMRWAVLAMAGCAILIACIGLFGLAANLALKKIKEIGIRKTLGASSLQITASMTTGLLKLIGVAFVIACPVTYYMVNGWLEGFSYRIELTAMTFVIGGLITAFIAISTVSYHAIKSGFENPVKSLRYE